MSVLFLLRLRKLRHAFGSSLAARALLRFRVLAGFEHRHVLSLIPYSTIVDVGANRGQFSLAARVLNPTCRLFAFEPLEGPAAIYDQVFHGDPLTVLSRVAIAAHNGSEVMHVSRKNDSSSLLPIGDLQVSLFPESVEVSTCQVVTARLAHVLDVESVVKPALLKIDVQGYELDVLKGSQELMHMFDYIYVECSFVELYEGQAVVSDVVEMLAVSGFQLSGTYNLHYAESGRPIQGDFLFSKTPRLSA